MKTIIITLAAFFITGLAIAQHGNVPAGHLSIGIKGGINFYNVHNDNSVKYDMRTGYNFGLLGHIHLNKSFAVQPEIVYSAQGARYTVNNIETRYKLDYINVPVLFQYMFDNGLRLEAGPQVGILVSAKSVNSNATTDNKADLNTVDVGVSFGGSFVVPATGFGVDARYTLGLTNINNSGDVSSTNRGVQLGVFYIFGHSLKIDKE